MNIFGMNIWDIEFWIESFLSPIQWKNEFSKRIGQGYEEEEFQVWFTAASDI